MVIGICYNVRRYSGDLLATSINYESPDSRTFLILCYFITFKSKYSPQQTLLKHIQSVSFPQCEPLNFTPKPKLQYYVTPKPKLQYYELLISKLFGKRRGKKIKMNPHNKV
jgi:hypothetical protein